MNTITNPVDGKKYTLRSDMGRCILKTYLLQSAGGKCSICGALGKTKTTCPFGTGKNKGTGHNLKTLPGFNAATKTRPKKTEIPPAKQKAEVKVVSCTGRRRGPTGKTCKKQGGIGCCADFPNCEWSNRRCIKGKGKWPPRVETSILYLKKYRTKVRDLCYNKLKRYLSVHRIPSDITLSAHERAELAGRLDDPDGWVDEPFINLEFVYYALIHYKKGGDIWYRGHGRQSTPFVDWSSQSDFSRFRKYVLKKKLNTLLFSAKAIESEQFAFMDSYFELLEKNINGGIYSLIRVDNYIETRKPIKFGHPPLNTSTEVHRIGARGMSPPGIPYALTDKMSEDVKLYPWGGYTPYVSFIRHFRGLYTLYGSALRFDPSDYTMEQSYSQFPAKGTPTSGTRYIDCFIRCVLNINLQSRLDTTTKYITTKFAKEFISALSKHGLAYTDFDLQLDMLRRMDPRYVYGFTRFNLDEMENTTYEVPGRYTSKDLVGEFVDIRKEFLTWSFFNDIDISCAESPMLGQSYITAICYTPIEGMGHWFNFGYYVDPVAGSYYFYSCTQSGEFWRHSTLVDLVMDVLYAFPDISSLAVLLRTPRTKELARILSPKAYADIPIIISFGTDDLSLPDAETREQAHERHYRRWETPINVESAQGLYEYFFNLILIVHVSKDHTLKEVAEIIESHPDVLKFEVSQFAMFTPTMSVLRLDNMNQKMETVLINTPPVPLLNARLKYHPRVDLDTRMTVRSIVPLQNAQAKSVAVHKSWRRPQRQNTI